MRDKPRIPACYWPWWMLLLAAGLFVFYVLLTPVWMGIRLVSWLAERFAPLESSARDEGSSTTSG